MLSGGQTPPHQSSRNEVGTHGPPHSSRKIDDPLGGLDERQHHRCGIGQQIRGHALLSPLSVDKAGSVAGRGTLGHAYSKLHPRLPNVVAGQLSRQGQVLGQNDPYTP